MFAMVLATLAEKVMEHLCFTAVKRVTRLVLTRRRSAAATPVIPQVQSIPEYRVIAGLNADGTSIMVPNWVGDPSQLQSLYRNGRCIRCRKRDASGNGKWREWAAR